MRKIYVLTLALLTGCAGALAFLDSHGQGIAEAVLECVPAATERAPEQVSSCLDATLGAVQGAADGARGVQARQCANALREAQQLRTQGEDSSEAEARAQLLVDRLDR